MTDAALARRRAFAADLARAAGALARRYFAGELAYERETKSHQDFVTDADRAVETLVRDAIGREFPEDAVWGEEAGGRSASRLWLVDPIDGTLNFLHGVRYWCISISYLEHGERQVAAIYDPSLDELFVAAKGEGATCNGLQISASSCASPATALIAHGHVPRHDVDTHLALRRSLLDAGCVIKDMGAGALMLAHVAAGRFDAFIEPHMHPWDATAGLLLVEEAGGRTLPYPGPRGLEGGGMVIASAAPLFDALHAIARQTAPR